jgi:hypothetical protein
VSAIPFTFYMRDLLSRERRQLNNRLDAMRDALHERLVRRAELSSRKDAKQGDHISVIITSPLYFGLAPEGSGDTDGICDSVLPMGMAKIRALSETATPRIARYHYFRHCPASTRTFSRGRSLHDVHQ